MGILSDLLGIPHHTTSRGSTVRRDFLEDVGKALGIPEATLRGLPLKDDVLAAVVEAATRLPMNPELYSPGGTVTNEVLQVIIDGITVNGVPGRDVPQNDTSPPLDDLYGDLDFDPDELKDERDRRLIEKVIREGQDRFRTALLEAYDGKCAISGYDAPETLEAAHIFPYTGPASNRVSNGLLLRSDLHALFDRGALAIHETSYEVLLKPHVAVTRYSELRRLDRDGRRLRLPRKRVFYPSTAALRSHRLWAGM